MTTGAASLRFRRAVIVLRVVKLDVECFVEAGWKTLQGRIVAADVGMTDLAHRHLRGGELAAMAFSAGFVAWKAWRCGVVRSLVTGVAGERSVTLARVEKL